MHLLGGKEKCLKATGGAKDKNVVATNFHGWLQALGSDELVVYADGSQKTDSEGGTCGK